jgi:hypothetical protein
MSRSEVLKIENNRKLLLIRTNDFFQCLDTIDFVRIFRYLHFSQSDKSVSQMNLEYFAALFWTYLMSNNTILLFPL